MALSSQNDAARQGLILPTGPLPNPSLTGIKRCQFTRNCCPQQSRRSTAPLTWEPAPDNAHSHFAGVLTITGKRDHCRYRVEEYPADEPGRAFVLFKLDAGTDRTEERYGCFLANNRANLRECRGFVATRNCKHIASLTELTKAHKI